ncbi:MAG: diguanylate cyclase (GGDEF)-like protein/PAS domain S-box-containing protein [Alphaproteobacteria bacterium]|jgi:diguanylate cyclase (GGDEF)-like protein/PAS domain S-box-containing protein
MPILIVTPELILAEKVRTLFLRQNSPLLGIEHHVSVGYEAGLLALEGHDSFETIVLVTDVYTEQFADFIDHVERHHKGPIMVMTDSLDVSTRVRTRGIKFILPRTSVDQDVFMSILDAVKDHYRLGKSVQQLEEVYQNAEQRFRDVADHFADWLWEIDKSLKIVFSSSRKRSMENIDTGMSFLKCFLPEEGSRIEDEFSQLFKEPRPFQEEEFWSFDSYGTRKCWSLSGVPVFDKKGQVTGYRGVAKDISNEKASVDHLYFMANNDALTGFYNRSRFTDELGRVLRRHLREGLEGALIVLNIDRFKLVNDSIGYGAGDKLVVHFAQLLKRMLRTDDFVARTGGDEFAIILSNTSTVDAGIQAKEILRALSAREFQIEGKSTYVTARAGGISLGRDGNTADELLSNVHIALGEAKARGSNTYCLFDELELRQQDSLKKMELSNFVSKCLEHEQERLILYYQPIVSFANTSTVERYEVLVRLLDEDNNIVSPVQFIEVAEEFGIISKLDRIVACRAMDMLEKWQAEGKNINLSINISGKTFSDSEVIERITHHLSTKNIKPASVIFELTETSALKDMDHARRVISKFKSLGAQFALDDCGVGYSSFDYIRQLDLDYIKIDGSFIRDLHRNKEDETFVRALRDIARRFDIKTVAEMVEEPETVALLRRLGIDFAQGYHFAMPAAELSEEFDVIQRKTLN